MNEFVYVNTEDQDCWAYFVQPYWHIAVDGVHCHWYWVVDDFGDLVPSGYWPERR